MKGTEKQIAYASDIMAEVKNVVNQLTAMSDNEINSGKLTEQQINAAMEGRKIWSQFIEKCENAYAGDVIEALSSVLFEKDFRQKAITIKNAIMFKSVK